MSIYIYTSLVTVGISVGTIPVAVDDADKEYTQNNDGWIEVHKLGNKDDILTVLFTFREPILLRQLQFEGKFMFHMYSMLVVIIFRGHYISWSLYLVVIIFSVIDRIAFLKVDSLKFDSM